MGIPEPTFFEIAGVIKAHVLDGPHFVLETHAAECAERMRVFVRRALKT